jgi:hypothetical protein
MCPRGPVHNKERLKVGNSRDLPRFAVSGALAWLLRKGQKFNSQASLSLLLEIQVGLEGPGDLQA